MNNSESNFSKKDLNLKAAKAGTFFVVAQLLVRGVTFLITPIYTRLVSTSQYSEIRIFESWLLILVPVLSLCMYRSVPRAKHDFKDDYEEYVSSVMTLSFITISFGYVVATVFFKEWLMNFLGTNSLMYVYMIMYTFAHMVTLYFQTYEKQMLRSKNNVILSLITMISATLLSVLFLYLGNRYGLYERLVDLRIIGYYTPQIVGGIVLAFIIVRRSKFKVNTRYWKYALVYSIPLIPEVLSIQIMNQSDKIMIQKMVSKEAAGIFALATTVSFIIWIIEDAVWGAWLPWLYEKIKRDEIADIQKPWDYVTGIFGYASWALVVFAPELIYILGGTKYADAIYLVSPMVTGTLFRFFSYGFTSVENYQKKTQYCALGTVSAMIVNVILNAIFIKNVGYQAAAYTTAFSYLFLLVLQGYLEKKVCGMRCISYGKTIAVSVIIWAINLVTILSYDIAWYWRYGIFVSVSAFVLKKIMPSIMIIVKQIRKG